VKGVSRAFRDRRGRASGYPPAQKKFPEATIFLDTEFSENYTFVSCNFTVRSIDV
jgi:hypothetical protein